MRLHVVGSGSAGNAYILRAGDSVLLLEAGMPLESYLPELARRGDWNRIVGCLVTHEHGDHAKYAVKMAETGIPVYASEGTIKSLASDGTLTSLKAVQSRASFELEDFTVLPFDVEHDAAEPLGYLVRYKPTGETLVFATDTYYLRYTFPQVNYWMLECNYVDEIMDAQVEDDALSKELRHRLKKSHMSLRRVLDVLRANMLTQTRAIVLIHLSDERSDERAMVKAVKEVSGLEEVTAATNGAVIDLELAPF